METGRSRDLRQLTNSCCISPDTWLVNGHCKQYASVAKHPSCSNHQLQQPVVLTRAFTNVNFGADVVLHKVVQTVGIIDFPDNLSFVIRLTDRPCCLQVWMTITFWHPVLSCHFDDHCMPAIQRCTRNVVIRLFWSQCHISLITIVTYIFAIPTEIGNTDTQKLQ